MNTCWKQFRKRSLQFHHLRFNWGSVPDVSGFVLCRYMALQRLHFIIIPSLMHLPTALNKQAPSSFIFFIINFRFSFSALVNHRSNYNRKMCTVLWHQPYIIMTNSRMIIIRKQNWAHQWRHAPIKFPCRVRVLGLGSGSLYPNSAWKLNWSMTSLVRSVLIHRLLCMRLANSQQFFIKKFEE